MVAAEPVGIEAVCALHGHAWQPAWLGHKPHSFGLVSGPASMQALYNSTVCALPEMAPAGPRTALCTVLL